ncbi:MAG: hypothetical protein V4641_20605 [Pseudomonadota bacterium]
MAALTITTRTAAPFNASVNTLGASDTLAYDPKKNQTIEFRNTTASPVVVALDGADASAAFPVPGTGGTTVDLSAGKQVTVPGVIGATTVVPLNTLSNYLQGAVTVTNGTGLTAIVLSD